MKKLVSWRVTRLTSAATLVGLSLLGCGGGSVESPLVPLAAGSTGTGGTGGTVTGPIANIAGDYNVAVSKFDCSASNQNPTTKLELQANGSCKVTSNSPVPGLAASVTLQRDILPEGRYTLRIAVDGSMELLQGIVSKAKVACLASGMCTVTGAGTLTTYTLAGGLPAAGVGVTQVIISGTGATKSVLSGAVYAIGNVTFTGISPLANGESGILIFASP